MWSSLGATGLVLVAGTGAVADHGVASGSRTGDLTTWLLVVGAIVALGLAAWAVLAPERPDEEASDASAPSPPGESLRR